jgi:hypothetical protein
MPDAFTRQSSSIALEVAKSKSFVLLMFVKNARRFRALKKTWHWCCFACTRCNVALVPRAKGGTATTLPSAQSVFVRPLPVRETSHVLVEAMVGISCLRRWLLCHHDVMSGRPWSARWGDQRATTGYACSGRQSAYLHSADVHDPDVHDPDVHHANVHCLAGNGSSATSRRNV